MMTLEQVKKDIAAGKCKRIYYSMHTLWWTHLDSDLDESTKQGVAAQEKSYKLFMARPDVPQAEKERIKAVREYITNPNTHQIPLDLSGSPLMQIDNVNAWIGDAEKKPEHFGKHGLDAFMAAHHQNSGQLCFSKWIDFDNLIDTKAYHHGSNKNP